MSKASLLEKLTKKEYRDALISEEIDVGLPMQLREMRESRGWKQAQVAKKIGTAQPRFPVMEKPGYGNFSLTTLKKLASVFDVGLIVSFVPYSEMIDFRESITRKRLAIPAFSDEYLAMEKRYSKGKPSDTAAMQSSFDYSGGTSAEATYRVVNSESSVSETGVAGTEILMGSNHISTALSAGLENTYVV
jgi:transcriptional regulator with XRE-family HTH domain